MFLWYFKRMKTKTNHLLSWSIFMRNFMMLFLKKFYLDFLLWDTFNIALILFQELLYQIKQLVEWILRSMKSYNDKRKNLWLKASWGKVWVLVLFLPFWCRKRTYLGICADSRAVNKIIFIIVFLFQDLMIFLTNFILPLSKIDL